MSGIVPEIPGEQAPPDVAHQLKVDVARLLQKPKLNFPGAQPVSFARKHIEEELFKRDYYVCEKSDGLRCLMYVTWENNPDAGPQQVTYLITRNNDFFFIPMVHFPSNDGKPLQDTIVDGELVLTKSDPPDLHFLMFDCLACNKILLTGRPLDKRLGYLNAAISHPLKEFLHKNPEVARDFPFSVRVKDMQFAYNVMNVFASFPHLPHITDGLIFTCRDHPYVSGTDERILKWKKQDENSVDFLMSMKFPIFEDTNGESWTDYDAKPEVTLLVWTGRDGSRPYGELYLTDKEWDNLKALEEPLEERVVECIKDDKKRWRYLRFRDDKTNANYITTVEKVIDSIDDPVSEKNLLDAAPKIKELWKERNRRPHDEDRKRGGGGGDDHDHSGKRARQ